MEKFEITTEKLLANWGSLNSILSSLSEDQIEDLIKYEKGHKNRANILTRLHQRYTILKTKKERNAILRDSNS